MVTARLSIPLLVASTLLRLSIDRGPLSLSKGPEAQCCIKCYSIADAYKAFVFVKL